MKTYRYSSYRQMSPWEATQAWSARRKAAREDFEQRQSEAGNAFANAAVSFSDGLATNAAQVAITRMQAEAKQKAADAAKRQSYDSVDTKAPPSVDVPSSTTLEGGSRLDLKAGTITLSNGTTIDMTTGVKKVNVTT